MGRSQLREDNDAMKGNWETCRAQLIETRTKYNAAKEVTTTNATNTTTVATTTVITTVNSDQVCCRQ